MLSTKLQQAMVDALKAKDLPRLNTIRYIVSQVKNKEIALQRELTDEEVIGVLQKIKKEVLESISSFEKGGREDLKNESQKQLEVVLTFLPKELSDDELKKEIAALITSNKVVFEKNPKALMGICVKELKSKADPGRIVKILQQLTDEDI